MNRQARRATRAQSKSPKLDSVLAIHEAGHAVGRIMKAQSMGFANDEAIEEIDMSPAHLSGTCGMVQATTYGPMFSRPMNDYLLANAREARLVSRETLIVDVAMCKSAGIDVMGWAKCKAVIGMFGPVAEAMFTARDVHEVVDGPECATDLEGVFRDCSLAGMSAEEGAAAVDFGINTAARMLKIPNVKRAVEVLAASLPSAGRMKGTRAARIIEQALGWSDPTTGTEGIAETVSRPRCRAFRRRDPDL
jgi:hypothetical protein